jgi:hypothetical protein
MIARLIQDLQSRGIFLSLADGQIRYRAPKDALTEDDKQSLRSRKPEIEAFLLARQAARTLRSLKGRPGPLTASVVQEMWNRFGGGPNEGQPVALNISAVLPVQACAPERLARILHHAVTRHETLLSRIRIEGECLHLSLNDPDAFAVEIEDLRGVAEARNVATGMASSFCALLKPVEGEWLTQAKIWVLGDDDCLAAISSSHIVSDAGTRNILVDEVNDLLEGRALPPPLVVFNDYSLAERDFLESPDARPLFDYWRRWYAAQPLLHAPDGGPPLVWGPGTRIINNFSMPGDLLEAVRSLASRHQVTPFLVHLTIYARALARWSGAEAFPVRILGDKRTTLELERTAGLMYCADPVDVVAPAGADFETVLRGLQRAYDLSLSLRLPTLHYYPPQCAMPGVEKPDIPNRIPAVFNFYAAGTTRERRAAQAAAQPPRPWPPQVTTLPPMQWTRPSAPVFLHFMDNDSYADLSLHFYENAVPRPQQESFLAGLQASYAAISAA